jgi:hypothetical protein
MTISVCPGGIARRRDRTAQRSSQGSTTAASAAPSRGAQPLTARTARPRHTVFSLFHFFPSPSPSSAFRIPRGPGVTRPARPARALPDRIAPRAALRAGRARPSRHPVRLHDDVIEHPHVDQRQRRLQAFGHRQVIGRGLHHPRPVAVRQDHRRGVVQQRALEHFARIDARLRQGPAKQVREGQQHVPRIEEQDHEALVRLPREVQLEVSETPHSKRNASPARSSLASISRARRRPHSSCVHPGSKESRTKPANRCGERPCAAYTRSASAPRNGHSALSTLRSRAVKTQAPEEIEEEEEDKGDALMTNSCTRHRRDCLRDPAIPSRRSAQGRRRRGARAEHAKRA